MDKINKFLKDPVRAEFYGKLVFVIILFILAIIAII
jgi:hypothetical protein